MTNRSPWPHGLLQWLPFLSIVGTAAVFWRGAVEIFTIPKVTIVLLAAAGIIAVGAKRLVERGALTLPVSRVTVALAAFLGLAALSIVTAPSWWRAMFGQRSRGTGVLLYLGGALVLLAILAAYRRSDLGRLVNAFLVAGGLVAAYAVLQRVGGDPFTWSARFPEDTPFSTLGNVNFVSGFLAIVLPLTLLPALRSRGDRKALVVSGAVALLVVVAMVLTKSAQGPIAAAAGLAFVVGSFGLGRLGPNRRPVLVVGGAVLLLGAAAVGVGLGGTGPLGDLRDRGLEFRVHYWEAAVEMTASNPVTGVGFDSWAEYYRSERSEEAAREQGLRNVTDAPHSVPLAMFASGGLPLGLAYLAFIVATGWTLVRALRRAGPDAPLVIAVGGAWVAYQVQSAVSIDVPPLAIAHLALAGAIVVLGGDLRWREVRLAAPAPARRGTARPRRAGWSTAVGVAVALGGVWFATRPIAADASMNDALLAASRNEEGALGRLFEATDILPWEPEYWSLVARDLAAHQQALVALLTYEEVLERDPRDFEATLNAARSADVADDHAKVVKYYERALELEPRVPELKAEFAKALISFGQAERAVELLAAVAANAPDDPGTWRSLGDAYRALGDRERALDAYGRSVELDPAAGAGIEINEMLAGR